MIFDLVSNISNYRGISSNLDQAIDYIKKTDFTSYAIGKHEIDGKKIFILMQNFSLKLPKDLKYEAHRRYIDIQIALKDGETIGYCPTALIKDWEPYNSDGDIVYSPEDAAGLHIPVPAGAFCLFFPEDAHRPLQCETEGGIVYKVVVKVAI